MENCIVLNGQKTDLTEAQVESIRRAFVTDEISSDSREKKLSDFKEGETFRIGEHEFIVLGEMESGIAVVLNDYIAEMRFGDNNNFADEDNDIRQKLKEFEQEMESLVGADNLYVYNVDLTANDGMKDYGSVEVKMSVMTADLRRRFAYTIDKFNKGYEWLATAYSTPAHNSETWVMCVSPSGYFRYHGSFYDDGGVRPFCILNSNIFVSK